MRSISSKERLINPAFHSLGALPSGPKPKTRKVGPYYKLRGFGGHSLLRVFDHASATKTSVTQIVSTMSHLALRLTTKSTESAGLGTNVVVTNNVVNVA